MLTTSGQIKIIDFGMALFRPSRQSKDLMYPPMGRVGKNKYMAPEIYADQRFNPRFIDIWSLGSILFFLLAGTSAIELPAIQDERYDLIVKNKLIKLVRHWKLKIKEDAVDLVQKMLQKNPTERISLDQIVTHEWLIRNGPVSSNYISPSTISTPKAKSSLPRIDSAETVVDSPVDSPLDRKISLTCFPTFAEFVAIEKIDMTLDVKKYRRSDTDAVSFVADSPRVIELDCNPSLSCEAVSCVK